MRDALDNRQSDLESLRIDRSQTSTDIKTPIWARRYIQVGLGVLLLLIAPLIQKLMHGVK